MLEADDLNGKRFIDAGCGSGLFSLVARQLNASVYSFDYDQQAVACTRQLKQQYFPNDTDWTIEQGSILDQNYIQQLGTFDIVYSWGVLHHTGDMWRALQGIVPLVAPGGKLFIAIYNDQGKMSRFWKAIKRLYNKTPKPFRFIYIYPTIVRFWTLTAIKDLLRGKPFYTWRQYTQNRGMSPWHDTVDWVGGYPFEVAKPEQIFDFYRKQGFILLRLKTNAGGIGCNEYVFLRTDG